MFDFITHRKNIWFDERQQIATKIKPLPDTESVMKCFSVMNGNFHVPVWDEVVRVIAFRWQYTQENDA